MHKVPGSYAEAEPLLGDVRVADRLGYPPRHSQSVRFIRLQALASAIATLLFLLIFRIALALSNPPGATSTKINPITPVIEISKSLSHSWAHLSPYFPADDYPLPPPGCKITQVRVALLMGCGCVAKWLWGGGSSYVGERGEHQPAFEMKFLIINFLEDSTPWGSVSDIELWNCD